MCSVSSLERKTALRNRRKRNSAILLGGTEERNNLRGRFKTGRLQVGLPSSLPPSLIALTVRFFPFYRCVLAGLSCHVRACHVFHICLSWVCHICHAMVFISDGRRWKTSQQKIEESKIEKGGVQKQSGKNKRKEQP